MLGQGRRGSVGPADFPIHVVLRSHRAADQFPEPVEHLAVDPGINVLWLRRQRLPARPGADERILNDTFRVDPSGHLGADPPQDHRHQSGPQPIDGRGKDRVAGKRRQCRLRIARHATPRCRRWSGDTLWGLSRMPSAKADKKINQPTMS